MLRILPFDDFNKCSVSAANATTTADVHAAAAAATTAAVSSAVPVIRYEIMDFNNYSLS